MTVEELIAKLSTFPPQMQVDMEIYDRIAGSTGYFGISDVGAVTHVATYFDSQGYYNEDVRPRITIKREIDTRSALARSVMGRFY